MPIHSLPREWLWCEAWCGAASRAAAKTIDLCNNPLTKEPKLRAARRIIAEWPDLNREAEEFTARVEAGWTGAEIAADESRFVAELAPMVEGSVRTRGGTGEGGEAGAARRLPPRPAVLAKAGSVHVEL